MRLTQLVMSLGCFGHAKMAAKFGLNQPTSNGCKSSFRLPCAKEKSTVLPSKVETLLLSKNLTCKNFISVALKGIIYGSVNVQVITSAYSITLF